MERHHRISAGAIVINSGKILLVRYPNQDGTSFLAAPGGGVNTDESTSKAAVREVWEETGLDVRPGRILFVEDLLFKHYRMTKIWFLCDLLQGELVYNTPGAKEEGITEVGWYRRDQLNDEIVYPPPVLEYNWNEFSDDKWKTVYLELRETGF